MKYKNLFIFVVLLSLISSLSFSQSGEVGTFIGTVTDTEGEPLPGVEVSVLKIQTGLRQSTITNNKGRYRIERLPRGFYEITATLAGFKTTVLKGLELFSGAVEPVNIQMEIGTIEEQVTVIGVTPIVETTRTQISTVMTEKELLSYPQANRNYLHLMQYAPGTQPDAPTIGGTGYAINGMRGESNNYMIDGISNNDMTDNTMETTLMPPEAIQEFRLITNNFSAEYGRNTGGILNVVMKSGTNEIHGSAWGFFRGDNSLFRSADWLTGEREPYERYQYGATVGGPIIKDKTFFFATFESIRQNVDQVTSQYVLTPEAISTATGTARTIFDKYGSVYPTPTSCFMDINGDGVNDYGIAALSYTDSLKAMMGGFKLDHIFSEKDRISLRWMYNFRETESGFDYYWVPDKPVVRPSQFHTGGLTWLHLFSPTMYNEVRIGYHRANTEWKIVDGDISYFGFDDELVGIGDPGYPMSQLNTTYQFVDVLNIQKGDHNLKLGGEFKLWNVDSSFDAFVNGYYIYNNGLEWLANEPASYLILGADPPDNLANPYLPGDPTGEWNTGFGLTERTWKGYELGLFFQDEWRIADRLTIAAGLRWEFYSVPTEDSGVGINQPAFGTEQGFLNNELIEGEWNEEGITYTIFDGRQLMKKGLWNNYYGNFAPKISFAYDLTGDGKTSLRSGYGISYDRQMNRSFENDRFNYPDFAFNSFLGSPWGGAVDYYATMPAQVPIQAAGDVRVSLRWMDPNLQPQKAHNWMVGIQREIGTNFSIEVDYTGSAGRKIGGIMRPNRYTGDGADGTFDALNPYIAITDGNFRTNSFKSNYHAAQLILNKRFSDGWSWYSSYTYGVSKDHSSMYQGICVPTAVEDWSEDYGYSSYDHRHRLVGGFIYELPFFRNSSNAFVKNGLGGWQIGVSYHFTSGRRFNITGINSPAHDWNLDGQRGSDRPLWLGGDDYQDAIIWENGRPAINPKLFAEPEPPAFERDMSYYDQNLLPKNAFTWYPTYNVDLSLQKNFTIPAKGRDFNLQLIMDVFNVFKSQFWAMPGSLNASNAATYGRSTFGQIPRKNGERLAQISLRFMF